MRNKFFLSEFKLLLSEIKIFIVFIWAILLSKTVTSQTKEIDLIVLGGISKLGTGDLPGYTFLNQVDIKFKKFFFFKSGHSIY